MFDLEGLGLLLIARSEKVKRGYWPSAEALRARLETLSQQEAGTFNWIDSQPQRSGALLDVVTEKIQRFRKPLQRFLGE